MTLLAANSAVGGISSVAVFLLLPSVLLLASLLLIASLLVLTFVMFLSSLLLHCYKMDGEIPVHTHDDARQQRSTAGKYFPYESGINTCPARAVFNTSGIFPRYSA